VPRTIRGLWLFQKKLKTTHMATKSYLIVGGTSGIGQVLAQRLTQDGHTVYAMARNAPAEPIDGVTYLQADVLAGEPDLSELPQTLDGLAYCPGSITLKPFQALKPEQYQEDFNINVIGAVHTLRAALSKLRKADQASVVFFSTVAVTQGLPYHASIAAAKGALEGMARSAAAELASKQVRVNIVAPSITETPMAESLLRSDQQRENSAQRHPLQGIGQPEDMASAARFLLSDEARWITGQKIGVDGGMSTLRSL
jgi:NAD(P)-dependent dehydrogenase (short-subunit alcohol dehydrogenase family)